MEKYLPIMKKIKPILLILSVLCLILGTISYIANIDGSRFYVSSFTETVEYWTIFDNLSDPFSFVAGFFWDLGLVLLVAFAVCVYIIKRQISSDTSSKKMSIKPISFDEIPFVWRIIIMGIIIIVSLTVLVVGLVSDMMWLSGIGLLVGIVIGILLQGELRTDAYQKMSDEKLINLYQEYAHKIQTALSVGNGLTGAGSTAATNKINSDIANYREKGNLIGSILVERGYTVNFNLLNGKVTKGKSNSDLTKIIKGAVTGGIIAGNVGAVIGAAHAINKNNKKK